MNQIYLDSARLLTCVAPLVLIDDTFALKLQQGLTVEERRFLLSLLAAEPK